MGLLRSAGKSVQDLFLEMAERASSNVEKLKTYLENNELDIEVHRNISLLGKKIFKMRGGDLALLTKDPVFSQLVGKIVKDQRQISKIKG